MPWSPNERQRGGGCGWHRTTSRWLLPCDLRVLSSGGATNAALCSWEEERGEEERGEEGACAVARKRMEERTHVL